MCDCFDYPETRGRAARAPTASFRLIIEPLRLDNRAPACGQPPPEFMSLENKETTPAPSDFIRDIVAAARRGEEVSAHPHALSAGAERLPAHRPRQEHLPELRHRARVRRHLQSAHGRHQPDQGRRRVCRFHHRGRELADRRLGGRPARLETQRQDAGSHHGNGKPDFYLPPVIGIRIAQRASSSLSTPPTTSTSSTNTPSRSSRRARPTSAISRRRTPTHIAAHRTGPARTRRSAIAPSRRTSICSRG